MILPVSSVSEISNLSTNQQLSVDAPIGVFDSGVGGLSILNAIKTLLPSERFIYVADTGCAPYGDRSDAEIRQRSLWITDWFVKQGCKAVVVACNTATAAAIEGLRTRFEIPIIGIEPGVKPAVEQSTLGRVGVLATSYTVSSLKFQRLINACKGDVEVIVQACPGLVETLERPCESAADTELLLKKYLEPMRRRGIDKLVLGCTHYSFLRDAISRILGPSVDILDTPAAVARELERQLQKRQLKSVRNETFSPIRYLTSGEDPKQVSAVMCALLKEEIHVERLGER